MTGDDDRAALRRRHRDEQSFSDAGWLVRMAGRNARWIRTQGVGRLIEEHELHPLRRTGSAVRKAVWRRRHGVPPGSATAVLLTGVPRSGTNMMVRGLQELPEFEVYNEGDRRAFRRYRLRSDEVVAALVGRSRHEFVLLKPLMDSYRVPGLLDRLGAPSQARGLWAHRNVDDTARSAVAKFGSAALIALEDIARAERSTRWQAQGMSEESLELLRGFDLSRLTAQDGVALMWALRHRLLFDLGLATRPEVLPVSYDALVADPHRVLGAVCRHLGVTFRPSVAARVDARSARPKPPLQLDPRVRALCDETTERLRAVSRSPAG